MSLDDLENKDEELADYEVGFQDRLDGRTSEYRLERRLGLGCGPRAARSSTHESTYSRADRTGQIRFS